MTPVLAGMGASLGVYAAFVAGLALAGRRGDARALATFIPDCLLLVKALLRDPRVPAWRKALLAAVLVYLALPIDLVPDFIPVAGQLDDAIVVALALRSVASDPELLRQHWRGPDRSLGVLLRFARSPA